MLSVKHGGIKYYFLSLWYDSTWDWIPVSRAIGEHSTHWICLTKAKQVYFGLTFESMSSKAHLAHIARSEPMTSIVQQGSSLGSCPIFRSLNHMYKTDLRVIDLVSSPVWWEAETNFSWEGDKHSKIHTFSEGINAKRYTKSLVQDLNSGHRFHFLRRLAF